MLEDDFEINDNMVMMMNGKSGNKNNNGNSNRVNFIQQRQQVSNLGVGVHRDEKQLYLVAVINVLGFHKQSAFFSFPSSSSGALLANV